MRILALAPQKRLSLRNHPVISASAIAALLVHVLDLVSALDRAVEPIDPGRLPGLAPLLDLDHPLVRDLVSTGVRGAGALGRISDGSFIRSRALNNDLVPARDLVSARKLARDLARVLARVLARARARTGVRARVLARVLNRARALARVLISAVDSSQLTGGPNLDLAVSQDLARRLSHDLGQAVSRLIGLDVVGDIAPESLYGLLDDFTQADLTNVDLTGIGLEGVRWSKHATRWPAAMDVGRLREQSLETPSGSGIYVVKRGPTTTETDRLRV
ncbi:hypothetical protein [Streptomyces sp. FH025]|uniref:hypothetical protein n=1 Tax=Streptomyces sp. FH025 TaxID=2815937 RepID=UPI001A9FA897|nr:hypothetical protein [Streptomyces sp. FH025]MBO1418590.1 hypothetical protein [Streptomyces sp. FH025]